MELLEEYNRRYGRSPLSPDRNTLLRWLNKHVATTGDLFQHIQVCEYLVAQFKEQEVLRTFFADLHEMLTVFLEMMETGIISNEELVRQQRLPAIAVAKDYPFEEPLRALVDAGTLAGEEYAILKPLLTYYLSLNGFQPESPLPENVRTMVEDSLPPYPV